jgi:hypothetical protein
MIVNSWVHPTPRISTCHDVVPMKGGYSPNKGETPNSELFLSVSIQESFYSRHLLDPKKGPKMRMKISTVYLEHLQRCSVCIWSCRGKNGWRKSNICWFDSGKWFWLSMIVQVAVAGLGAQQGCAPAPKNKKCNKYDLTTAQCFWLVDHNNWSRWFAISSPPHLFAVTVSVLLVGVAKEYITKTWMWKIFS